MKSYFVWAYQMHFLIAEMHFMHKQQWVIVFIWLRWPLQLFSDLESASLKMSFILYEIFFKILFLYDAFDFYQILPLSFVFMNIYLWKLLDHFIWVKN